ncbi:hypothetical protein [Streptomyces luteocolor]|uniref:hypothetical protein n=1 Tax=Streptomyces luteocolor TaxID=285500 RepID=UPI000852BE4B|nr:hypothetical protein [Streptomyces luteocolor]
MRIGTTHARVQRIWSVELRPEAGGPVLVCPHCPRGPHPLAAGSARSAALAHLAQHARRDVLAPHLRTCQCFERGCRWHPRHRGCSGAVRLLLMRAQGGRLWRLADACAACAAATAQAAVVPDALLPATPPLEASRRPRTRSTARPPGADERVRVKEMLTYLAAALPRFSSPTARLLALQCALRADRQGRVELREGFLRGMRLASHAAPWHELEHAGWLRCTRRRRGRTEAQLLDAAALAQAPSREERARAAHWALHPAPLTAPRQAPPSVQLAALVLAVHTGTGRGSADTDALTRLCATTPPSLEDLLDQLTRTRTLASWRRDLEAGETCWQPPEQA